MTEQSFMELSIILAWKELTGYDLTPYSLHWQTLVLPQAPPPRARHSSEPELVAASLCPAALRCLILCETAVAQVSSKSPWALFVLHKAPLARPHCLSKRSPNSWPCHRGGSKGRSSPEGQLGNSLRWRGFWLGNSSAEMGLLHLNMLGKTHLPNARTHSVTENNGGGKSA